LEDTVRLLQTYGELHMRKASLVCMTSSDFANNL
jgi:hypothetical protein